MRAFVPVFPSAMRRVRALPPADTHLAGVSVEALMGHQTASSLYLGHHDVLPTKCWAWSISPQAVLGPPGLVYAPPGILEGTSSAWWQTIPSRLSAGRYLPRCHVLPSFGRWGCHLHFPIHRRPPSQGRHGPRHSHRPSFPPPFRWESANGPGQISVQMPSFTGTTVTPSNSSRNHWQVVCAVECLLTPTICMINDIIRTNEKAQDYVKVGASSTSFHLPTDVNSPISGWWPDWPKSPSLYPVNHKREDWDNLIKVSI